jgi:hypothetical protein
MEIIWNQLRLPSLPKADPLSLRVRALMAREGRVGALWRVAKRLFSAAVDVRCATVFVRTLSESIPAYEPRTPITVRQMTFDDLVSFRQAGSSLHESRIAEFAGRLKTGRIGAVALAEGRVASYGWLSLTKEMDGWLGLEISLKQHEGYIYDGFTFPAFRGLRIYPSVLGWRLDYLRRLRCDVVYSIVLEGNSQAIKWHRRMGFGECRRVGYVKVLGRKRRVDCLLESYPAVKR